MPWRGPHGFWDVLYRDLLDTAGVPRKRLFATNVHPALWSPGGASGNVPRSGRTYRAWYERVGQLLADQFAGARPAVIAALGAEATREVGRIVDVDLRAADGPVAVDLPGDTRATVAVSLAHPSARPVTMARRTWGELVGREADAALLGEAWNRSKVM